VEGRQVTGFTILPEDTVPEIPLTVAMCPICGGQIYLEIDEWEQEDDGLWSASASGVHVDCTTAPEDMHSAEWDDWFTAHWSMPYVDWLPVEQVVYKWLFGNYRFKEVGE
jgi:hypothetical protein